MGAVIWKGDITESQIRGIFVAFTRHSRKTSLDREALRSEIDYLWMKSQFCCQNLWERAGCPDGCRFSRDFLHSRAQECLSLLGRATTLDRDRAPQKAAAYAGVTQLP